MEDAVGVRVDVLGAIYVLESIRGFGPNKFKAIYEQGIDPSELLARPGALPVEGKIGADLIRQLERVTPQTRVDCVERAHRQINIAHKLGARIVSYWDRLYPPNLFESSNPLPVLYARGSLSLLHETRVVACVGSRKIRAPYLEYLRNFASAASLNAFTVVSGFALGADTVAHRAAIDAGGKTICVLPCGLDRPFPPENRELFRDFLENERAVLVSEFPFGMSAKSLTLRKRNKTIVALARGVLVSQSAEKGGAMNAYRFGLEQRKTVATFAADEEEDTSGNKVIAADERAGRIALRGDDKEDFDRWLHQLSSWTWMGRSGTATPGTPSS